MAAIKREEKKLKKRLKKVQRQLKGVRSAAKYWDIQPPVEVKGAKKRVRLAAGRAAMAKAAKKRRE